MDSYHQSGIGFEAALQLIKINITNGTARHNGSFNQSDGFQMFQGSPHGIVLHVGYNHMIALAEQTLDGNVQRHGSVGSKNYGC